MSEIGFYQGALDNRPSCPRCGTVLDGYTGLTAATPEPPDPGDMTICAYCATWLVFEDTPTGLDLREADEQERAEVLSTAAGQVAERTARNTAGTTRDGEEDA